MSYGFFTGDVQTGKSTETRDGAVATRGWGRRDGDRPLTGVDFFPGDETV